MLAPACPDVVDEAPLQRAPPPSSAGAAKRLMYSAKDRGRRPQRRWTRVCEVEGDGADAPTCRKK